MKKIFCLLLSLIIMPTIIHARSCFRNFCATPCFDNSFWRTSCCPSSGFFGCCNNPPYCGPYPRPLPGQYDSFKDNTRMIFWNIPPCAPRNDSKFKGYLYKGMWWDNSGVRYWAVRNSTKGTITFEGLEGGALKNIPAGDVANIERGESYGFRVQAPARRLELFASEDHNLEIFINLQGDLDYRVEIPTKTEVVAKSTKVKVEPYTPKF